MYVNMFFRIQLINPLTYGIGWRVSTIFWGLYSQPLHMNIALYFILLTHPKHSILICVILMHPQRPDKPTAVPVATAPASLVSRGSLAAIHRFTDAVGGSFSPLFRVVFGISRELRLIMKFGERPNKHNLDPSPTSPCPTPHSNPHLGWPGYPEVNIEQSRGAAVAPLLTDRTTRSLYRSRHHTCYQ